MKPQEKFINNWKAAKAKFGASEIADKAKITIRTFNNAVAGKEIDPSTYEKINKAIIRLLQKEQKTLNLLSK